MAYTCLKTGFHMTIGEQSLPVSQSVRLSVCLSLCFSVSKLAILTLFLPENALFSIIFFDLGSSLVIFYLLQQQKSIILQKHAMLSLSLQWIYLDIFSFLPFFPNLIYTFGFTLRDNFFENTHLLNSPILLGVGLQDKI